MKLNQEPKPKDFLYIITSILILLALLILGGCSGTTEVVEEVYSGVITEVQHIEAVARSFTARDDPPQLLLTFDKKAKILVEVKWCPVIVEIGEKYKVVKKHGVLRLIKEE